MRKRNNTLDRKTNTILCECGGNLKVLYIDGNFTPHTRCKKCGKEHVGLNGTKKKEEEEMGV